MKKLSWILIITLLASCLSACGKKETVIYQGDTASTSDATDDPIRNLDYTVPGDKGTLTVQAQVDTSLAEKSAPVASLSRADFTDEDIQAYADLIFDEGSYSLFMPYDFRSIEDLTSACGAWEDTFKSYENFSTIPEYMIAEYYDATNVLATKKQDADAAKRVVETNGEMKWYINPYSERDDIGQFIPNQFCIIDGTISKEHYYLAFFKSNLFCRMVLYKQYCTDAIDFSTSNTYKAYPISSAYVEQNGGNSCSLSLTEAKQITEKYMQTLKITDYTIVQTLDAIRHPQHYTINASFAVEPPAEETEPATDSYLFYASRSLNNLSTLYTSETFSTTLTDYSNAEYDANGGFISSADESNTFYGFESLTASIDSNGLSYLIWNNPMQVDTIEAKTSPTLSFDQIDAIAKAQIDFMSIWNSSPFDPLSIADCEYTVTSIEYGLIRISDSKHKSYSLVPAWFYMLKPDEAGILYKSSYAIINAIDGSIYNPFIGTLEPTDNSQTEK